MRQGLEKLHFVKSNHDNCLFTNGKVIVFFMVYDAIFFAKQNNIIDTVIQGLQQKFLLGREEDVAGFLGIKITRS